MDEDLLRNKLRLDRKWTDDEVDALIAALRDRAGLLQSRDAKTLEFHYRFEEFLAGCHLTNEQLTEGKPFPKRVIETLEKQGDYARKTVLWAAGVYAHARPNSRFQVRDLITALATGTRLNLEHELLAAEIARDSRITTWDDEDTPRSAETALKLRKLLIHFRGSGTSAANKAKAAAAIGILGDERPGVGCITVGGLELPDIEWCHVDAGPFPMCNDKAPYANKKPRILFNIPAPYSISRYPVTVAQYAAFMAAGGYDDEALWTKAGWHWLREQRITGPERYTRIFQTPNHPRVGVSWYKATAFAAWLHSQRAALGLAETSRIALPSEAQWERAARHTDAREYPWGSAKDDTHAAHCNWDKTGIGSTSAVGLFPAGKAECGADDMAGNVWEWCFTFFTDNYSNYQPSDDPEVDGNRVVRGGSWGYNNPDFLRASCRVSYQPGNRFNNCGFRVMVVGVAR